MAKQPPAPSNFILVPPLGLSSSRREAHPQAGQGCTRGSTTELDHEGPIITAPRLEALLLATVGHPLASTPHAILGDSTHPSSSDPWAQAIMRFIKLFLLSFRESPVSTDDTVHRDRKKLSPEVVKSIESSVKRSAIRNLRTLERFTQRDSSTTRSSRQYAGLPRHVMLAVGIGLEPLASPHRATDVRGSPDEQTGRRMSTNAARIVRRTSGSRAAA
ncbi:hypothetical protein C8Q76DRAFT_798466 [Earliella scabrosa]|nr:hypothetical protein C8Q76DRAFT_798444 [Earliella scabrosa]KAI0710955.1 hypothetical protein C8Q76DRAFT_798466 [Earliella scabrosa]